jgi:outer membrane protein TolC
MIVAGLMIASGTGVGQSLSLRQALEIGLGQTMRGEMIEGNLEVAEQLYSARRINMYLPEISINGSIPSFRKSQAYEALRGELEYGFSKRRNLDFTSNIELKQTLITGGSLTARADLLSQDKRYPDMRFSNATDIVFIDQLNNSGSFSFFLQQPLFRPSLVRTELDNRKDDLGTARVTRIEETAALRKEITEAYTGVIQQTLQAEMAADKLKQAQLQQVIDSTKLADEVLSAEEFLLSRSSLLDAELAHRSAVTDLGEIKRELATLLDIDVTSELSLTVPVVAAHIEPAMQERMVNDWEQAAPIKKAEHVLAKAERQADYAAAGHGLTGDLAASYSFGEQRVETDFFDGSTEGDYSTNSWTVALNFKLPIWDGGAGSAAVQAARYQAEQARYEFTRAKRSARSRIVNLVNQLDVSYQRLDIIRQQIDLATERLSIAEGRFDDGRISESTLLESKIFMLDTRHRYLEELKKYLLNRIDLESQYLDG